MFSETKKCVQLVVGTLKKLKPVFYKSEKIFSEEITTKVCLVIECVDTFNFKATNELGFTLADLQVSEEMLYT